MARLARAVIPDIPYHVTHRGNHRGDVFFCDIERLEDFLGRLLRPGKRGRKPKAEEK